MPTGVIELLKIPGVSLASGIYPLIGASAPGAWWSITGRYVSDLTQSIRVPYRQGVHEVNMVRFDGSYWWIIAIDTSTDAERSAVLTVTYCAPTSLLRSGDAVSAVWSRTPEETSAWLQRQAISAPLKHARTWELPTLPKTTLYQIYWVQATVQETETSGDATLTHRLGCFVSADGDGAASLALTHKSDGAYPKLSDILTDAPGVFGTTADSILDISISIRCPYLYTDDGAAQIYVDKIDASGEAAPTVKLTKGAVYDLDSDDFRLHTSGWVTYLTTDLTSLERASGTVTLRTEDTSPIATYPPSQSGGTRAWKIYTLSDLTGVYTYVSCEGYTSCIQEGHLPWSGTSWEQYRAYSLAFDRQAMEMSIGYAHQRQAQGLASAAASSASNVAMGAIGGSPASIATGGLSALVGFGLQAWAQSEELRISDAEARDTQALAERRAMGGPSTPYNSAYGLIYCLVCWRTPASIWLEMPDGLTSAQDSAYTAQLGYPSELIGELSVQEGYYRGSLISSDASVPTGPRFDKLVNTFRNGFRFKEV